MTILKTLLSSIAATGLVLGGASANAAEVNLRLAHFMPDGSWQQERMFKAWKEAVEEESNGRIKVSVFPAQTLGKASAGYDNAKKGITDIAWTVQGYTAGRFPLSQLMELPGLFETGAVGSCAFQKLFNDGSLDDEYKDTKVLYVHTHSPGHLHTKEKKVVSLEDLEGLKIRRPTDLIGSLISELGAEPIGMPAPDIYQSVQRGVIDGYMLPWETIKSFRTFEVTEQHLDFGFYSLAFVMTMNKRTYEKLPSDLKTVIDNNSGMKWSVNAGKGYDEADLVAIDLIKETGGQINKLSDTERKTWTAAADKVADRYIKSLDEDGLPGSKTYSKIQSYVNECQQKL